jgi:serine/threonine protein kinase
MGEVYRGRDTRLDRSVAIKVLPAHLSQDEERRRRFQREARLISNLSHPNICTLFDVGSQDNIDFLVMELLEGESLAHRLEQGPLGTEQVLRYGIQIAEALEAAHRQRPAIVHRDLKPGNIMLTKSGAKLLDFGLATYAASPSQQAALSSLATADSKITDKNVVVGTFQYMAPEQLEGKEADARTDIFALGSVLYEMVTGRPAFRGDSRASLIGHIMNSEPEAIGRFQPLSPPALDRVIRTCLAKDPDERWQTAHDVKLELKWILEGSSQAGVPVPVAIRRRWRERAAWAAVAVLALAAVALGIGYLRRAPVSPPAVRFNIEPPPGNSFEYTTPISVSPDAQQIAFVAQDSSRVNWIWVRPLNSAVARRLEGTANIVYGPRWSADGRAIVFHSGTKLKRVSPEGGPVETLCDLPEGFIPFSLNEQGVILGFGGGPILRFTPEDCSSKPAASWDKSHYDVGLNWPVFLPDGRHFLYAALRMDKKHDIYWASLDDPKGGLLVHNASAPTYADGYLFYQRDGYLSVQPFDPEKRQLSGEPISVMPEQLAFLGVGGFANYSVRNNILLYHEQPVSASHFYWYDFAGKQLSSLGDTDFWDTPRITRDSSKILAARNDIRTHTADIWAIDVQRGSASHLTHDLPPGGGNAVWAPDGKQFALGTNSHGYGALFLVPADGSGDLKELPMDRNDHLPLDWSADGKWLLYNESTRASDNQSLWAFSFVENKGRPLISGNFNIADARISPDGRWVAYLSSQSGRDELYVTSFPQPGVVTQISTQGAQLPRWDAAGHQLIYATLDWKLMSVPVSTAPAFKAGEARPLFTIPKDSEVEVAPDGKRLLVNQPVSEAAKPLTVLVNWQSELGKR